VTGRHENDRAPNKVSNQVSMASNRNWELLCLE
jgi:hypothetical protein